MPITCIVGDKPVTVNAVLMPETRSRKPGCQFNSTGDMSGKKLFYF